MSNSRQLAPDILSKYMDIFCLEITDEDDGEVSLHSPSSTTTTVIKNVIRHVTDVLQRESRHTTAIGTELSKTNNPTAYTA
jgi:hypothetical protein